MAAGLPNTYKNSVKQAEAALAGIDTLHQRDGSDTIYNAWFEVAKLHARRVLDGNSEVMRAVTLDALSRLVRNGSTFISHTLADDYVVVAMLRHVAKILSLLHSKPKFRALLIAPTASSEANAKESGEAAAAAAGGPDPQLVEIAGSPEERRRFADALPPAFIEQVMAVATSHDLGTERRCCALRVVQALATLATEAREQDGETMEGTALLSAVSPDTIAHIAASAGHDAVLRAASMDALRSAAGRDADSYAPKVARTLIARASDVESLLPVWGMGALRNKECVDLVVRRVQRDWAAMAAVVKAKEAAVAHDAGPDPALAGVASGGFLGIAGSSSGRAMTGLGDDIFQLPQFAKAVAASLYESLLNDRAAASSQASSSGPLVPASAETTGSRSYQPALSAVVPSSGTGVRTISAGLSGGKAAPGEASGTEGRGATGGAHSSSAMHGAATMLDDTAHGLMRVLKETDVTAAVTTGALPKHKLRGGEEEGEEEGGPDTAGAGLSGGRGSGAVQIGRLKVDMDLAPERPSEWLDLARLALELRPNDDELISLLLAYPSQESLEAVSTAVSLFSAHTWRSTILPWLHASLASLPPTVSGSSHHQAIVDTAREWARSLYESGSAAASSFAVGSASGSASSSRLPDPQVGRLFFRACLLAISRGYAETERFPEIAAKILSAYLSSGHDEAMEWVSDALAPSITRNSTSFRATTELVLSLVGAEAASVGGDLSGGTEAVVRNTQARVELLGAATRGLTPGALSLWASLAVGGEAWVSSHPGSVTAFAEAVEDELDAAITRMAADPGFSAALLRPVDALHIANATAKSDGRVAGFVMSATRWDERRGERSGSAIDPEALSISRGGSVEMAVAAAAASAAAEEERVRKEGQLGSDPFSSDTASLAVLPVAQARRKVLECVDTLRAVAHVAPARDAASLFSALLKGLALLPPDLLGAHRSDIEAASLIDKIAQHRTAQARQAREARVALAAASKEGKRAEGAEERLRDAMSLTEQPPLPPEVVEQALTTLGPTARASLARIFPAMCANDPDTAVRVTALRALSSAAWTHAGSGLVSSPRILLALLQATPTESLDADKEVATSLLGTSSLRWAEHWPYSTPAARALPLQYRRLCQGLCRPTTDVLERVIPSMGEIQVTAAPALAAAAIATGIKAEAESVAAGGRGGVGVGEGLSVKEAGAVAAACCSRLLFAAKESAASDSESLPDRTVINALGSIASNCPRPVLVEMVRSPAGRAMLGELRRISPQWARAVGALVSSGVLMVHNPTVGSSTPGRVMARQGYQSVAARDPAEAIPVPGGVPHAEPAPAEFGVRDDASATLNPLNSQAGPTAAYEFELAPMVTWETGEASKAAAETRADQSSSAAASSSYQALLRQFENDTEKAMQESLATRAPAEPSAPLASSPLAFPAPSAPPSINGSTRSTEASESGVDDGVFGAVEQVADGAPQRAGAVGSAPGLAFRSRAEEDMAAAKATEEAKKKRRGMWEALRGVTAAGGGQKATGADSEAASLLVRPVPAASAEARPRSDEASLMLLMPEAPTAVSLPPQSASSAVGSSRLPDIPDAPSHQPVSRAAGRKEEEDEDMLMMAM